MNTKYMNTKIPLKEYFVPTAQKSSEISKARIKNSNLPFLQKMYNGNSQEPLYCLISKRLGWIELADFATKKDKKRFVLDFNHIRQRKTENCQAGKSVDKSGLGDPSGWWRTRYLDPLYRGPNYSYVYRQKQRELDAIEFMTIMPITSEIHSFITQDSAKSDITLQNFEKETWAWCLQSPVNFNETKMYLKIEHYNIDYNFIIDHLSNIKYKNIRARLIDMFN